jgi:hypothetical protein
MIHSSPTSLIGTLKILLDYCSHVLPVSLPVSLIEQKYTFQQAPAKISRVKVELHRIGIVVVVHELGPLKALMVYQVLDLNSIGGEGIR